MQAKQDAAFQNQQPTPRAWFALGSYFGPPKGDEIIMSIGERAVHFLVDANSLRQSSRHYDQFLAENPPLVAPDGIGVVPRLPDIDPEVFSVYWKWLSCRNLVTRTPDLAELEHCYLLGRSFEDWDFVDLVLDAAIEHSYHNDVVLTDFLITVYLATEVDSLHRLWVEIYILQMWRKDFCRYAIDLYENSDHGGEVVEFLKALEPACRSATSLIPTDLPGNHLWDLDPCRYHEHTKHHEPCYRIKYNFQEVHPRPF